LHLVAVHPSSQLSKLQLCAEELARLEEECVARGSVCSSIRQSLVREANNGESAINEVEEYRRQVAVAEQRWKPENVNAVEKNRLVKKVRELVRTVRDGADDDIVMQTTSDSAPQHCPCTMGPLENPVVNKQCGHVYSTAGIIGLLCQGRAGHVPSKIEDVNPTFQKPCPRVGCSKIVNASMLERDFRTEASQRQARRRAATQHDPDDDDNVEEL
jgi:SUMO ligase MMS21 Smc5/6 complex component